MATATHPLDRVPAEAIAAHADQVRPAAVLTAVITALFFAAGWTVGAAWRSVVYCCLAVRYGYRQGAHVPIAQAPPEQQRP